MFNHNTGKWEKQEVYLGMLASGQKAYFTNRFLVHTLTPEQYDMPTEWHIANCNRLDWVFVPKQSEA